MKCPKCDTNNPDDSKYCKECATPFPGAGGAVPTKTLETSIKGIAEGIIVAEKYRIIELLGRGGMGVVYKAEDIKLKRTVALKFLAPELTREKEAKERFILEAQAASSLNHSNICTIHEIDESDGQMFIVMAYIEGRSLREQITQGPLKLEEALGLAAQIAAGLHEAHEKGIIHRDIKSSNIMIDDKGQAIIMDFGIAKLAGETKITRTGTTVGTVAYMSPEQARGEKVDHKTDIWSLGVVLYDMVIGQLPFKGDHDQAVIYSILNENPEPMTALRTGIPMELERIVSKALQKDPSLRYQHTDDLLVDLKYFITNITSFSSSLSSTKPWAATSRPKKWMYVFPWSLAVLMIIISIYAIWQWRRSLPPSEKDVFRYERTFPSELKIVGGIGSPVQISPDGNCLVVYINYGENRYLFTQRLDGFETSIMPGTDGATCHFFSPDGKLVGYRDSGMMKKVGLTGGLPSVIAEIDFIGASWGEDDLIIFGQHRGGLSRIPASGGAIQKITEPAIEKGEMSHRWPHILPNGKAALFTIWRGDYKNVSIGVVDLGTGITRKLFDGGTSAHYVQSGHIVFAGIDESLSAVPFNLSQLEVMGPTVQILEQFILGSAGDSAFSVSNNGTLAYRSAIENYSLVFVDFDGKELAYSSEERLYRAPRFSHNGEKIAVGLPWVDYNIWVYSLVGNTFDTLTRFTYEGINIYPTWTPDSMNLVFSSRRLEAEAESTYNLYMKPARGSGDAECLMNAELSQFESSISPDGKHLVYRENHPETGTDLWILPLEGNRKPHPYIVTPFDEYSPMISPNGNFVAYTSNESNRNDVYVRTFPDSSGGKWQISSDGGTEPLWTRDGKNLIYRDGDEIVSVAIETEPQFKIVDKRALFKDVYITNSRYTNYDVHPDDKYLVMIRNISEPLFKITVVQNWPEELRRIVPTDK
jgi:serine/threonine-protein kinase